MLALASVESAWAVGGTYYVSATSGDDSNAGTAAAPFKTIAKALSKYISNGSSTKNNYIMIEGGVYTENLSQTRNYFNIQGSYVPGTAFASRDVKNHRTIVKAADSTAECFKYTGTYCKCYGIDFTGGTYGFIGGTGGSRSTSDSARQTNHQLFYQCVFSNNVCGVGNNTSKQLQSCISCLFANNERGFCVTGTADSNYAYCYNCTFAGNSDCAVYRSNSGNTLVTVNNCLFTGNGTAVRHDATSQYALYLDRNLYWNNTTNFSSALAWTSVATAESACGNFRFRSVPIFQNPQLAADYVPGAGSFAAKAGADLSTTPAGGDAVTEDLYGNAWNGEYDIGCFKTDATSPITSPLAEVYVSPAGDDTAAGDSGHPLKTPDMALMKVAANGKVHLADGTYTGTACIRADGVSVIGESRDGVILRVAETLPDNDLRAFALGVFARDAVISNVTFTTSPMGVLTVDPTTLSGKSTVENCLFEGNRIGIVESGSIVRAGSDSTDLMNVGHSIFRNNVGHGIAFCNSVRAVNCLFTGNNVDGINGVTSSACPPPVVYLCTFIQNGSYAYQETFDVTSDRPTSYIVNSLFYSNGRVLGSGAAVRASSSVHVVRCAFYGNANLEESYAGDPPTRDNTETITDDPKLILTDGNKYARFEEGSPCAKAGSDYVVSGCFDYPTDDLAFDTRPSTTALDIGCYISPETQEDLIGHGYSYLTIVGEPSNYGSPNLGYGKTLYKDGTVVSLSIADGMETFTDGQRGLTLGATKRAAYKGFVFKRDYKDTPEAESASDETLVNVTVVSNTTWKLRWQHQYEVIASQDAQDCSVTLGDKTTPACSGETVAVTNWIAEGASFLVRFDSTADYQFTSWGGDFPGDTRINEQTLVCAGAYVFYPLYKSIICVSQNTGDDTWPGTAEKPYKTIVRGMSRAHAGDIVRVATGVYHESVTNTTVDELTLEGGYTDAWVRDLKTAQTIIEPSAATLPCVYLEGVVSNTVRGFVLQGGKYGIVAQGPNKTVTGYPNWARRNNRLEQLIVRNNTGNGIHSAKTSDTGLRVVSSLIYGNGGNGINLGGDNGAMYFIHNCTVVRNTGSGLYQGYGYNALEVRNSILAENGGKQLSLWSGGSGPISILSGYNCFFSSDTNLVTECAAFFPIAGNYFLDPMLKEEGEDYSLGNTSPYHGLGEDLTDYSLHTELEDLYGVSWDGKYDLGAIRSDLTPTLVSEVNVTAEDDLQRAILRCAESGTVHVAAGTYVGPVCIQRRGVRLVGEGAGKSVITGYDQTIPTTEVRGAYAVQLGADDIVMSGFTVCGVTNGYGVLYGTSHFARNQSVEECTMSGNLYGVGYNGFGGSADRSRLAAMLPQGYDRTFALHRLSHCRITGNTSHGICAGNKGTGFMGLIADNSLIADNLGCGVWMAETSGSGFHVDSYFYYCTVAANGECGFYEAGGGDSARFNIVNSIITLNTTGIRKAKYEEPTLDSSVLGGNAVEVYDDKPLTKEYNCSRVAPTFESITGAHAYCPVKTSSAYDLARALTASDKIAEPADDLTHSVRSGDLHRDAGCRTLPPYGTVMVFF